jgi:hypothetical protein
LGKWGEKLGRVIASILTLQNNFSKTILQVNRDTRSFQQEILHAQNSVVRFKEKAVSSFTSILGKASLLAGGIGFIEMSKASIKFASDLTEVQNVVDVTFGDMNKQINEWSKNAMDKYGENELQAKNFASTFGAMLKAGGVSGQELVKWSELLSGYVGDLSSFRNLRLDESFEKIRSAVSGEAEPFKALGYDVSETAVNTYALAHGIEAAHGKMKEAAKSALDVEAAQSKYNQAVKKYGQTSLEARQKYEALQKTIKGTQPNESSEDGSNVKLTQAEKLQARLGLIQQLMKDVDGDFVRTKTGFSNQMRIAQSQFMELGKTIGTKVLPSLTNFLISLTSGNIGHFGDVVVKVFDSIGIVINNIKPNLENLWNSLGKFAKNMGITDFFKNMFGGKNTKLINDVSYVLKVVIDSITKVINIAAAHPDVTKALFVGLIGGLVALKGATGAIKIVGIIEKTSKATKGLTGLSKIGGIFSSIFKLPPQALLFVGIIALVAGGAYLIIKNWSKIKPWLDNNFTYLKNQFFKFWNFIQPLVLFFIALFDPIIGIPLVIITYWKPISSWFKKIGDDIVKEFNNTVLWFRNLKNEFWNSAVNTFEWFKNGAWSVLSGIGKWIANEFNDFINFFTNLPNNALIWGADIVHSLRDGISNTAGDAVKAVTDLAKIIVDKVKEFFGIRSPSRVFMGIGIYLVEGLIKGMDKTDVGSFIKKWIGGITGDAGSAVGGNVTDWITQALAVTGTDSSWTNGLLRLASYESGDPGKLGTGNPDLVNNIQVGNEYATGLMQMLPSTFKEFQVSGMNDIKNPIHNIAAAIQYIKHRYGSVYNTPLYTSGGSYMGYATGTSFAGKGIRETSEYGAEIVFGRHYRAYQGGEKVVNANDTANLLGGKGDIKVYVIVQGNVIGNEEYADSLGSIIAEKIISAHGNI